MSEPKAPGFEKFPDQVRDVSSTANELYPSTKVGCFQCDLAWNGDTDNSRLTNLREKIYAFVPEKRKGHIVIEFRAMRQIVVESLFQTSS